MAPTSDGCQRRELQNQVYSWLEEWFLIPNVKILLPLFIGFLYNSLITPFFYRFPLPHYFFFRFVKHFTCFGIFSFPFGLSTWIHHIHFFSLRICLFFNQSSTCCYSNFYTKLSFVSLSHQVVFWNRVCVCVPCLSVNVYVLTCVSIGYPGTGKPRWGLNNSTRGWSNSVYHR